MQVYNENRFYNLFKLLRRPLGMVRGEPQGRPGSRCRSSGAACCAGWALTRHLIPIGDGVGVGVGVGRMLGKTGELLDFSFVLGSAHPFHSHPPHPSLPGAELESPPPHTGADAPPITDGCG